MDEPLIHDLLERVRRRWRRLLALRAVMRAALASAVVLAVALVVARIVGRAPVALAAVGVATLMLVAAAVVWGLWPAREVPSDQRVARFIEEADATLGDSFVSAVAVLSASEPVPQTPLAAPMLADAARRASRIDPAAVVPPPRLRRAGFQAAAAVLLFGAIGVGGRSTARQSFDALSLSLFPAHVRLDVTPGDARIMVGSPIAIEARLSGNSAPVVARLLVAEGDATDAPWRATEMAADATGGFRAFQEGVSASFRYRVSAGAATSPIYHVAVARPPRVTRIDLDYTFPKELGLPPRSEEDTGDIYAPAGSTVRVRVHTDRDVASARMAFGNGSAASLTAEGPAVMAATVNVVEDGSYRVALADSGGLSSAGDTEYFIRTLEDRPPDVHVVHPARDREVTRLEEVDVEARADDDFGIASMDLVYAVRGGPEKVVPFAIPARAVSATGTRTLYLEDLNVQPGDFVSYYVRARDLSRGKQSSETKSDLFFLEVRPFDQEFKLADSQGSGAGSGNRQLDDLVQAQKDVIVATWKLDRRGQAAGKTSPDDVRAVAKAESELKRRVEETASAFGESTLRDPRARGAQRATQARPGEDDMTAAASAMGSAVATLGELKTSAAVPPEMDALNHLLRAQADVKERQVQMQQAGSGNGANRSNLDLSNLFDKELQRQQKTSYESKAKAESDQNPTELDKIRDLAKRQDELNQRQQELARKRPDMPAEELKRELEKLTRDQSDLRQKAEEIAQEMGSKGSTGSNGSTGSQGSQGSQSSQSSQAMRDASEAMRNATNSLRQQNPGTASAQGAQASDKLRALADQLGSQGTDGSEARRRALGNMQLETRQMADAERQIASSLQGAARGSPGRGSSASGSASAKGSASASASANADDANRRLAGDEERLADRAARVQAGLNAQAAAAAADAKGDRADSRQTIASAARDFERQRMAERMKQAADALRSGTAPDPDGAAETQMARDLDRLADALASAVRPADAESQKLTGQRAQAEALRAEIDRLSAAMKQATNSSELTKLRDQYAHQLQQVQQLVDQLKREDPSFAAGGVGVTFEGQGMTLSAPGTEAFKQDFAKWDDLRVKAADALARAESSIDQRLQANDKKDRLAAGADDRPPAAYQTQVNSYFKALADRKKP